MNTIAFVIPQRGRVDHLATTLDSVARLDLSDGPREVVVVSQDVGSSKVESVVSDSEACTPDVRFRLLSADPEGTISASRNLGAAHTDSEFIDFLNADMALSTDWAVAMLRVLRERDGVVIASAVQRVEPKGTALERLRCELANLLVDLDLTFLPGRNLLMRRDTFDAVGGFPEHLESCEDYWFTDRALRFGALHYSIAAGYVHVGEDRNWSGLFAKELWRAKSNFGSLRGRHIDAGEYPSLIVPPAVLACAASSIVAVVLGAPVVAAILLVAALAPIGAYAVRLWMGSRRRVAFATTMRFYPSNVPARAIGMLAGLRETTAGEPRR